MPHRAHLFSLRIAHALREACFGEPYTRARLLKDLFAGVTVGIIAIPLAMALAIASGVAPQYGLYTAFIAGLVIALTGGSRYSVSGPTAAFVVILFPIAQKYGLGGLMLASIMAGGMLIVMAYMRLGRFIEYIPPAVTLGFTGGIAVVIAVLQVKDFFGLAIEKLPEHFVPRLAALGSALPDAHWPSLAVAAFTLLVMLVWPRLRSNVPPHLPAVVLGSLLAVGLHIAGLDVDTIGSRFSYALPDGGTGHGIPPFVPRFEWPWLQPGPDGAPVGLSWQALTDLLPAAFGIAMLGAIESLLCAVVLDGMSGKRHSANSELLGQGLGNVIAPFFGGITATAALARSTANIKSGAESPVAAAVHALVVLAALVSLAPLLSFVPMATMAALLVMVAWGMSEAPKALRMLRTAPRGDVLLFITCLSLTVFFDMVIAITTGVLLAAVLFMKDLAELTRIDELTDNRRVVDVELPPGWKVFRINGPLFFAAADRVFGEISTVLDHAQGLILSLEGVPLLDSGGVAAMEKLISKCRHTGKQVVFTDLHFQPLKAMARAQVRPVPGVSRLYPSLHDALSAVAQGATQGARPT